MSWEVYCHSKRKEWVVFNSNTNLIIPIYKYLLYKKKSYKANNSMKAYAYDLMSFYKFLQHINLDIEKFDNKYIEEFRTWLFLPNEDKDLNKIYLNKETAISGKSWNRIIGTIISYIKWLKINKYKLIIDVSTLYELKKLSNKGEAKKKTSIWNVRTMEKDPEYITGEERKEIRNNLSQRDLLIFDFIYFSGMRIGEVFSFEITSFIPRPSNSKVFDLKLNHSFSGKLDRQTKTGSRTIYIPNELYQRLNQYIIFKRGKRKHNFLFVTNKNCGRSQKGSALVPDSFRKNLSLACKKSNLDFVPHDLRHTLATDILRITKDIRLVQDILGHKSITTTQKYTHPQDEDIVLELGDVYQELYGNLLKVTR